MNGYYLNGELEEDIFMEPPPDFDIPDSMILKLSTLPGRAAFGTKMSVPNLNRCGTRTEAEHEVFVRFKFREHVGLYGRISL